MHIVERGDGHPQCWVTGITVSPEYPAVRFDRSVEPETPYGPIYLGTTVVKQLAKQLGMISQDDADALRAEAEQYRQRAEEAEAAQVRAAADLEQFRAVVEKFYTPAVETHAAELKIGQGKPGPGRPKKVTA